MGNAQMLKIKTIFKAVFIPIVITAVVLLAFWKISPVLESRLPNASQYTADNIQNIQEVDE